MESSAVYLITADYLLNEKLLKKHCYDAPNTKVSDMNQKFALDNKLQKININKFFVYIKQQNKWGY